MECSAFLRRTQRRQLHHPHRRSRLRAGKIFFDTSDGDVFTGVTVTNQCSNPSLSIADPGTVSDDLVVASGSAITDLNISINATLDDEAASPVEDQCSGTPPAISGTFIPNNALSAFDGESVAATTWRLTVTDSFGGDGGTLNQWCVIATSSAASPTIFSDGFESGNLSAWSAAAP